MVDDYRTGGGRIVHSIAATHSNERKQLVEEHEKSRLDYIQICEDARRQINSIGTSLRAIDTGSTAVHKTEEKILDRLSRLQQAFPLE